MKDKIIIFSDGSSRGNPGPGGWGAIVAFDNQITELGGGTKHTTNNKMELTGAIESLKFIGRTEKEILLNTDSSYVINGITKWVFGWQKNGWKNKEKEEVANRELWEELIEVSMGKNIKWNYVGGHSGISGNERCDEIATNFADGNEIDLYKGNMANYKIDLNDLSTGKMKKKPSKKKGIAYSYLSLVEGVLLKHKTWAECEKRVKGTKGARYEKAESLENEKEIIKKWGLK